MYKISAYKPQSSINLEKTKQKKNNAQKLGHNLSDSLSFIFGPDKTNMVIGP